MQPQVTAAAGRLGSDTAAAVQGTWGWGRLTVVLEGAAVGAVGGTFRELFVFSFGGGGVEVRLSKEKRKGILLLDNRLGETFLFFLNRYFFTLKALPLC
jgi:hypothetical protein